MLFDRIDAAPLDPVLVSIEQFAADPRAQKVNLGVGMYYDAAGRIPLMAAVRQAESRVQARLANWGYGMSEGLAPLRTGAAELVFGADAPAIADGRVATIQSLGGTGALRLGAELLARLAPGAQVALSTPSWANHPSIFAAAGLPLVSYPYYDRATGGLDWPGMRGAIAALPAGSIVVLHACCHNPTGVDLDQAQWLALRDLMVEKALIPFLDLAYQGFADGLEADALAPRLFAATDLPLFVATSFSKSFALYGERVGALLVVTRSPDEAANLIGQCKNSIRNMYSTPPTHGAALVGEILGDPALRTLWASELETMRQRIHGVRAALYERLAGIGNDTDLSFIVRQKGLFSYTGLSPAQMIALREAHAIHAVADGRICVAALNEGNVDRVAAAIRAVVGAGAFG